jgi:hypothetical protein
MSIVVIICTTEAGALLCSNHSSFDVARRRENP